MFDSISTKNIEIIKLGEETPKHMKNIGPHSKPSLYLRLVVSISNIIYCLNYKQKPHTSLQCQGNYLEVV